MIQFVLLSFFCHCRHLTFAISRSTMFATSTMTVRSTILALHLIFSFAAAQKDNGDECSCFRTNGSADDYFTNHQFHDYRNIRGISSIVPTLITNITDTPTAFATSDFFLNDAWTSVWTAQNWNNSDSMVANSASVLMINSPNNVYIGTCHIYFSFCFMTDISICRDQHGQRTRLFYIPYPSNVAPERFSICG